MRTTGNAIKTAAHDLRYHMTNPRHAERKPSLMVLAVLGAVLALLCLSALSVATGYQKRAYPTLPPTGSVELAGRTVPLADLAAAHQPQLLLPGGVASPRALAMWWEAAETGDALTLVYHPVWEDEWHPNPVFHAVYYVYRAIVYGIPVRDIEYIQVTLDRSSGEIRRLRYEGSTASAYDATFSEHRYVIIDRLPDGYTELSTTQSDSSPQRRAVPAPSVPLRFGISTWSHQLELLQLADARYTQPVTMPLAALTDGNYALHKLARRSQGDLFTPNDRVGSIARTTLGVVMLGLPYAISRARRKGRATS